MAEEKMMRLSQVARKLNVGRNTIIEHLSEKGFEIDSSPNTKITPEQYAILAREFADSAHDKEEAHELTIGTKHTENVVIGTDKAPEPKAEEEEKILIKNLSSEEKKEDEVETVKTEAPKLQGIKVVGKIDVEGKKKEEPKEEKVEEKKVEEAPKAEKKEEPKEEKVEEKKVEEAPKAEEKAEPVKEAPKEVKEDKPAEEPQEKVIEARADKLQGLKVVGKIELPKEKKKSEPVASSDKQSDQKKKRPRKRISKPGAGGQQGGGYQGRQNQQHKGAKRPRVEKEEPSDKEIQDQIKATLAKLSGGTGKKQAGAKYRREKRSAQADAREEQMMQEQEESKTLKVTEFISANDLASLLNVSVNDVISTCMSLGMFVSINQRLVSYCCWGFLLCFRAGCSNHVQDWSPFHWCCQDRIEGLPNGGTEHCPV